MIPHLVESAGMSDSEPEGLTEPTGSGLGGNPEQGHQASATSVQTKSTPGLSVPGVPSLDATQGLIQRQQNKGKQKHLHWFLVPSLHSHLRTVAKEQH